MGNAFEPVYLWRKGNPQYWADAFFDSWLRYDPGENIRLTLLLKGFDGEVPPLPEALAHRLNIVDIADVGFDLTAYKHMASLYPDKAFLFLNSHSRFEAPNWHAILSTVWEKVDGKGMIGASGSWEIIPDSSSFPNVHLRTNGFIVSSHAYLQAAGAIETRRDCLLLEAGKNSLTQYFLQRDQPVLVVSSTGSAFLWEDWPASKTFRSADQDHLLVSDNRSRHYHYGSRRKRHSLAKASWGDRSNTQNISIFRRMKRLIRSKYLYFSHKLRLPAPLRSS